MSPKVWLPLLTVLVPTLNATESQDNPALFKDAQFGLKTTYDIVYGSGAVGAPERGAKDLLLDLYEPKGVSLPGKRPGFIAIHGGGWKKGHKRQANIANLCHELATRGYVCVSIDYRLDGDEPPTEGGTARLRAVRAAVEDAEKAVKWFVTHADRYRVDTNRIAIGGGSAGAVTALLLTYGDTGKDLPVRAVIDLWGGMGDRVGWIEKGKPPVIIIHGTKDPIVPISAAEAIASRANAVGVACEFYAIEGAGHGVPLAREVDGMSLYQRPVDFLFRQMALDAFGRE